MASRINEVGLPLRWKQQQPLRREKQPVNDFESHKNTPGFEMEMGFLEKAYRFVVEIKDLYERFYQELIPFNALRILTCCAQLFAAESLLDQAILAQEKLASLGVKKAVAMPFTPAR